MKKFIGKFLATGIWAQPIIMIAIVKFLHEYNPRMRWTNETWMSSVLGSFLPILFFWAESVGKPKEESAWSGKQQAMYPEINKSLLYKKPTGIVMGKDKRSGRYVCKDLHEDGHVILIGGSGSGKSSCSVIPSLLANPTARIFAVDIKGELSFKSAKYGDEHVLVFNPSDMSK